MKKLVSLALALLIALCVLPVGAFAEEEVVLKYISTGAGSWETYLQPIIDKYYEETGVKVELECYAHTELFQVLDVQFSTGNVNYDIIAVDVPMVANYATNGYILPLTKYFTEDEMAKFVDAAISGGSWDGEFYAPPMNTSAQLLWYNKDMLAEAGLRMDEYQDPDHRITYEKLYEMAKATQAVVDPDGSKAIAGISWGQISRAYQMLQLPNSLGEKSIGDDGLTVDGVINTDGWVKAMTYLYDAHNEGVSLRGTTADEQADLFFAGKSVFLIDGSWNSTKLAEHPEIAYTYSPAWEGYEDKVATPTGSWHYGVASGSKHAEAAIDFVKYMTCGEGADMWLEGHGDVPARADWVEKILTDPSYNEFGKSVFKIACYEAANTAYPRPVTPAYSEYESLLNAMFEDVRNGADPAGALDECVMNVASIMNKYRD